MPSVHKATWWRLLQKSHDNPVEFMEDIECRNSIVIPHIIIFPDAFIYAIMEIKTPDVSVLILRQKTTARTIPHTDP